MKADILTAAIRVLTRHGAARFTTIRVAEEAGVSVGSLYQYFPNKEALLFALHLHEIEETWREVRALLEREEWSPRDRVRAIVTLFLERESAESAAVRELMEEVQARAASSPEHQAVMLEAAACFQTFLRASMVGACAEDELAFRLDLFMTVIESVGKRLAGRGLSSEALHRWSAACSDMLCDHLGLAADAGELRGER